MNEIVGRYPLRVDQIAAYREEGFLCPIDILSSAEASDFRARLEECETVHPGLLRDRLRFKPHLVMQWADQLVHHPRILDAVESLIGPDMLCWESVIFTKEPQTEAFISWHQDITYWGLEDREVVTVWIALSPSTPESGCMRVVPGTHKLDIVEHIETDHKQNMLSRGQTIAVEVDESKAVDMALLPGQMSLHHVKLFHASHPNRSSDRRIGFAIRYIPTSLRQTVGEKDSAMLVRGEDRFGYFNLEPRPRSAFDHAALDCHQQLFDERIAILMRPLKS